MKKRKVEEYLRKSFSIISLLSVVVFFSIYAYSTNIQKVSATATVYYVSPNGSDTNTGSQSAPFATIQKAANVATAGSTVHVLPGTYTPITINTSGTATAPITFISDTKWAAKIVGTGNGSTKSYIVRNNASYIHIIGFDISGTGVSDGVDNFGAYNLVQGNHIHNMSNIKCSGTPGGSGLGDDAGTNNTYDSNVVNNIGNYPTKCDYVHGIYVDDTGDIVTNNMAYNNVGNGLYTNHGTGSVLFANNLSYANKEYGVGVNGSASGNIVENNILIGNGIAGIKTWSGTSNTQITDNILYNNVTNLILDGSAIQTGTMTTNPQLVNYQADGTGDYHLTATSPAIDAGTAQGAPAFDYDGNARPQGNGFDIGPYEFVVATSVTPQPSTTTIPTPTNTPSPTPTPTLGISVTPTPQSGVSVDAPASSLIQTNSTKSFSWNHTVGTQSNRLLMVQIVTNSSSNTVASVKYSGSSLTKLSAVNCGSSCRDEVWYLLSPASGTNSIAVTTSSSAPVTATALSLYNVVQGAPFGTAQTVSGTGTASSVSPTTNTTQLVADFYGNQATPSFTPTIGAGQTQQVNVGNSVAQEAAISTKSGNSPSTPMNWSWSTSNGYADIAVGIN